MIKKTLNCRRVAVALRLHLTGLFLIFGFLAPPPAFAQSSPGHSGGQHLKVGQKHIEFVGGAADTALIFVVTTDKDRPVRLRGDMIRLTIEHHGRTTAVPVVVEGLNMLVASLKRPLPKGAKISVNVQLAKGNVLSANFTAN